jgi:hypothetical protein
MGKPFPIALAWSLPLSKARAVGCGPQKSWPPMGIVARGTLERQGTSAVQSAKFDETCRLAV